MTCNIQIIPANELSGPLSPQTFFFHHPSFICRHNDANPLACVILRDKIPIAQCAFEIQDQEARSLPLSPFGSFDLNDTVTEKELTAGLELLTHHLKSRSIKKVYIRLYPECYHPMYYKLQVSCLSRSGFREMYFDESQFISVNPIHPFRSLVHDSQYRHLNFGYKKENYFSLLGIDKLEAAYNLLKYNRKAKNFPMTMSLDQLKTTFEKFPTHYSLFGFHVEGHLAAASVCIHVNNHILYDFYHGHDERFSKHSPVIALLDGLYAFAQKNNYELIDLGLSTEKGVRNQSLFRFKSRIGAKASLKPQFIADL